MEIDPADLEIVDGVDPAGRVAGSRPADRRARRGAARLRQRVPAGRGPRHARSRPASPRRPRPTSPTSGSTPETGDVTVLGYVVAQDVGRALNPALVEGQMRGAAAQGIGWALHEELIHDDEGQLLTGSFLDYALPRAAPDPRHRHADRRGAGARRAVRGQGDRRGVGHPGRGRGRVGHRRRRRPAPARDADDAARGCGRRSQERGLTGVPAIIHPGRGRSTTGTTWSSPCATAPSGPETGLPEPVRDHLLAVARRRATSRSSRCRGGRRAAGRRDVHRRPRPRRASAGPAASRWAMIGRPSGDRRSRRASSGSRTARTASGSG